MIVALNGDLHLLLSYEALEWTAKTLEPLIPRDGSSLHIELRNFINNLYSEMQHKPKSKGNDDLR